MPEIKCCGQVADYFPDIVIEGTKTPGHGYYCQKCGNRSAAVKIEDAQSAFMENAKKPEPKKQTKPASKSVNKGNNVNNQVSLVRKDIFKNQSHLMEIASPIIASDKGAVERLVKNNLRYVESSKALDTVWQSEEGQASIFHETEEAMIMGIELGKMGDLVPYGNVCQLIPSVEAYKFVLSNGNNSPFVDLGIECVHENDEHEESVTRKHGFDFMIKKGSPRGEIVGVIVWAERRDGKTIGDYYDADRLMEKAAAHSTSYQYYLQDKAMVESLRSEGKLLVENGREYFNKKMFKRGGDSWNKKVFVDDIRNPYEGPDKPEMLRKSAGKSFLAPYMKVRNSEAAMAEARTSEEARDQALKMGRDQVDTVDGDFE